MHKRSFLAITISFLMLATLDSSAGPVEPTNLIGSITFKRADRYFGGFSAIELDDDGTRFTALSDRGAWTQGYLSRDAAGRITSIQSAPMHRLRARGTAYLSGDRADSEGLAIGADGVAYVSLERAARVLRYASIEGPAENLPIPAEFGQMQFNSSLEALAIDARGWLYTLPERSGDEDRPFPIYRFRNGKWDQPFTIPRQGTFLPVGADFGPDGRLYILERQFRGLAGFASRIRRYEVGVTTISAAETVLETRPGLHGYLEGLSVWRDATGALRATMVSDDNFRFFLRSEIVEYRIAD
ncbi:MAG: esterase-like activity of phytase family protein [Paracoccaceae bacterium]|nr:esterase-like activity of phytase family protein [Paracoccaceae bacterium]